MLVRLKECVEKRDRIVERLPGREGVRSVNVRRDLDLDFCLIFDVEEVGRGGAGVSLLLSLYSTRNRVVFPPSSSMFEATMSRPKVFAARRLAIAAEIGWWVGGAAVDGEVEDSRCMAAAEVEEVSIRSVWERCFKR